MLTAIALTLAAAAACAPDDERLAEWPALADEARAKVEVARLRNASTEEMGEDAAVQLVALGAGTAPLLLDALGKERDEEARARIVAVLEDLLAAPHTRLLVPYWQDGSEPVRLLALDRVARFPDPGLSEPARAHFLALGAKQADPKARKKPSDDELEHAARAALSAGALEGLPSCLAQAEAKWRSHGAVLRLAGAGAKGPAATVLLLERLGAARTDAARVAVLHLLAVAGTTEAVSPVRRMLDAEGNSVRVAAINALRGIVDGAPPLENLSVFSAIEEAKKWKERT